MDIEFATDYLCQRFLRKLDPEAKGAVVEVGLGSCNFSFQWAAPLGYRCLAVEPLPTDALISASKAHGVELIQAALVVKNGEVPIYHGELHGHELPDTSSLNPRWWGVSERYSMVSGLTLLDLCTAKQIDRISLLKVDTEGSESDILSLLPSLPRETLPRLIVVEYGGGGNLRSRSGGWAPEFLQGTQRLLETAKELDYHSSVILEMNRALPISRRGPEAFDVGLLFEPDFNVGNLILVERSEDTISVLDLLRTSIFKLMKSECRRQMRGKTCHLRHCLQRIRCRLGLASR